MVKIHPKIYFPGRNSGESVHKWLCFPALSYNLVEEYNEKYDNMNQYEKEEKKNCKVEQILQKMPNDSKSNSRATKGHPSKPFSIRMRFDGNRTKRIGNDDGEWITLFGIQGVTLLK